MLFEDDELAISPTGCFRRPLTPFEDNLDFNFPAVVAELADAPA